MTTKLPDDLRQAIDERDGAPVYLVDDTTKASYVLMRAEHFEKIQALTDGEDVEAMYPLLAEMEPDDWDDISHSIEGPLCDRQSFQIDDGSAQRLPAI